MGEPTIFKELHQRQTLVTDVAEIGVRAGKWTVACIEAFPTIARFICVDPWDIYEERNKEGNIHCLGKNWYTKKKQEKTYQRFLENTKAYTGRLEVLRGFSKWASDQVEDGCLDLVYVDANHEEPYVEEDIRLWYPKLRAGGMLAGHDYDAPRGWGVKLAVDRMFGPLAHNRGVVWWVWKDEVAPLSLF